MDYEIDIKVRDLRAGDYLLGSRQTVIEVVHVGRIKLRRDNGAEREAFWLPNTSMRVRRQS